MVNSLSPGGDVVVAVSVRLVVVPSGRSKANVIVSPLLGTPVKATDSEAGEPAGALTVALLRFDVSALSLKPKGETASSSTCTDVAVGVLITKRPRPLAPRSA